jgi:AraC-like DNA-binding protein
MINDTATNAASAARLKDSLGCLSNQLYKDQELETEHFRFYRKGTNDGRMSAVTTPASDRGFLVGISQNAGHRRRIIHGSRSALHDFEKDSIYLRDFADDYKADLHGAFDFVLIEVSRAFITNAAYDRGGSLVTELSSLTGQKDAVLGHLAQVVALTLERKNDASQLFVDQLGLTIGTYLIEQFGNVQSQSDRINRRLSPLHEARAKEMLLAKARGNISIEEIASACNLSRSYFIHAFRETTDRTPHQWLLEQRIERARHLLKHTDTSLSEIAIACGFSDQSHFTRTFSQLVGVPPGTWRRQSIN